MIGLDAQRYEVFGGIIGKAGYHEKNLSIFYHQHHTDKKTYRSAGLTVEAEFSYHVPS